MKRWLLPLALLASAAIAVAPSAQNALACSVDPDFDLGEDSELIVAGRFTGWELDTESGTGVQFYDPKKTGGLAIDYAGIRAKMLVDRIFKGTAPSEITVTSGNTLAIYDHEPKYVWIGSSGACGAFDEDPTGSYAIMGLSRERDGTYGAFIGSWFFLGPGPAGERYERALERLDNTNSKDFPWLPAAAAAILGPLAFLAVAAFVWRRGERHNG